MRCGLAFKPFGEVHRMTENDDNGLLGCVNSGFNVCKRQQYLTLRVAWTCDPATREDSLAELYGKVFSHLG
jgi:hypothetical protein